MKRQGSYLDRPFLERHHAMARLIVRVYAMVRLRPLARLARAARKGLRIDPV